MEEKHRTALRENRTTVINEMEDLEGICDLLSEKNILTNSMVQDIMAERTKNSRHRKLLDTLPRRGPEAFDSFCTALMKTHQAHIAMMLDPNIKTIGVTPVPPEDRTSKANNAQSLKKNGNQNPTPVPVQLPMKAPSSKGSLSPVTSSSSPSKPTNKGSFSTSTQPESTPTVVEKEPDSRRGTKGKTETTLFDDQRIYKIIHPQKGWPVGMDLSLSSREFTVEQCSEEEVCALLENDTYPMSGDLTKRALIICNRDYDNENYEDRKIADMDSYRFIQVLVQFGFNVENCTSLTEQELMKQLKEEKTQDSTTVKLSIFMLVILSYGGKGTVICKDGKEVNIQDIINMFSAKECPLMAGVPKLFLIQACGVKFKDNPQGGDAPESKEDEQMKSVENSLSDLQLASPALSDNTTDTQASMHTSSSEQLLSEPLTLENNNDILVAMATSADVYPDGKQYSSQFLLGLSQLLCHHAKSEHFINLLQGINRLKQRLDSTEPVKLCEYKHSLTKKLFLMPGYSKKC